MKKLIALLCVLVLMFPSIYVGANSTKLSLSRTTITLTNDGYTTLNAKKLITGFKSSTMTLTMSIEKGKKIVKINNKKGTITPKKTGTAKVMLTVRNKKTEKVLLSKIVSIKVVKGFIDPGITSNPTNIPTQIETDYYQLGLTEYNNENYYIAIEYLKIAYNNPPSYVPIYDISMFIGNIYSTKLNDDYSAKDWFVKSSNEGSIGAYLNLGNSYLYGYNDYENAFSSYVKYEQETHDGAGLNGAINALMVYKDINLTKTKQYASQLVPLLSMVSSDNYSLNDRINILLTLNDTITTPIPTTVYPTPTEILNGEDYTIEYPSHILYVHANGQVYKMDVTDNAIIALSWYDYTSDNPMMWSNSIIPNITYEIGTVNKYEVYIYYDSNGYPNKTELYYNGTKLVTTTFESNNDGSCKKAYWYPNDGKTYVFNSITDAGTLLNGATPTPTPTPVPQPTVKPTITPTPTVKPTVTPTPTNKPATPTPTQKPVVATPTPTNKPAIPTPTQKPTKPTATKIRDGKDWINDEYWQYILKYEHPFTDEDDFWLDIVADEDYEDNEGIEYLIEQFEKTYKRDFEVG